MAMENSTSQRSAAPAERHLDLDEYWNSLEDAFSDEFFEEARKDYERESGLQMA